MLRRGRSRGSEVDCGALFENVGESLLVVHVHRHLSLHHVLAERQYFGDLLNFQDLLQDFNLPVPIYLRHLPHNFFALGRAET